MPIVSYIMDLFAVYKRHEMMLLPDGSAEGQLALGITGGRTLSNKRGSPPPILGFLCGIEAFEDACDGPGGSSPSCFSNLANSSSN